MGFCSTRAKASESMWKESAINARLCVMYPTVISAMKKVSVITSMMINFLLLSNVGPS